MNRFLGSSSTMTAVACSVLVAGLISQFACSESEVSSLATVDQDSQSESQIMEVIGSAVEYVGIIEQGTSLDRTFYLLNRSGHQLRGLTVKSNCACTSAKLEKTELEPGEMASLQLFVVSDGKLGRLIAQADVMAEGFDLAVAQAQLVIDVNSSVKNWFEPTQSELFPPDAVAVSTTIELVQQRQSDSGPVPLKSVRIAEGEATLRTASQASTSDQPGIIETRWSIEVTIQPDNQRLARGRVVVEAVFSGSNGEESQCRAELALDGTTDRLVVSPSSCIYLGPVLNPSVVHRVLTISGRDLDAVRGAEVVASGDGVRIVEKANSLLEPSRVFEVILDVKQSGAIERRLLVRTAVGSLELLVLGWADADVSREVGSSKER